jgi:hypothetical protein
MRGHRASDCTFHERPPHCRHCGQDGHRRMNCTAVTCSNCKTVGHSAAACPVPIVCSRCGDEGHMRHECRSHPSRRTFNRHQALNYRSSDDENSLREL